MTVQNPSNPKSNSQYEDMDDAIVTGALRGLQKLNEEEFSEGKIDLITYQRRKKMLDKGLTS